MESKSNLYIFLPVFFAGLLVFFSTALSKEGLTIANSNEDLYSESYNYQKVINCNGNEISIPNFLYLKNWSKTNILNFNNKNSK